MRGATTKPGLSETHSGYVQQKGDHKRNSGVGFGINLSRFLENTSQNHATRRDKEGKREGERESVRDKTENCPEIGTSSSTHKEIKKVTHEKSLGEVWK